ncbi:MAG: type I-MYXAN CRISPR-associated protein Cmx8, partial [Candidatus Tectomicrobia bacterium]|nr:type I-MYXAN CRISPR-associated protein Cmx8 [Candidatus Tectomicrobia bacterium]
VDVVHVEKQGNVIKTLGATRLDPEDRMIDDYTRIKGGLWHPQFRKQRLINLVNSRAWYAGFDALMCNMPYEQSVGSKAFRHDAREALSQEGALWKKEGQLTMADDDLTAMDTTESQNIGNVGCEALVYRVVGVYLYRKLKSKYQLEWSAVKDNPRLHSEYENTREKLARETFLAVRSRSGLDFTDYFASTLCSVAQPLSEQQYVALAQALYEDTEKVRTLTMLALAARS